MTNPEVTRDALAERLFHEARRCFGEARAEALRPALERAADHLSAVTLCAPDPDDGPAFYSEGPRP
jgi:hypothetical protein